MKRQLENELTRRNFTILLSSTILASCVSGAGTDTADSGDYCATGSYGSGSCGSGSCDSGSYGSGSYK